ncbi:MAG TPA: hypothetical protein VGH95_02355 [Candidatus Aquirickettsiella sp.]
MNEGLIELVKNDFTLQSYKSYLFNFFLTNKNPSPEILYDQDIMTLYFSNEIMRDDLKNSIQERLGSIFFIVFRDKNLSCFNFPDNIGKYIALEVCDPQVYPQSIPFNSGIDFNNPLLRFFFQDFSYRKRSHDFVSLLMQENIESFACSWREEFIQWLRRLPLNCEQHNQAKEKLNELSKRFFYNAKVNSEILGLMKNNRGYFHNQEQYGPIYFYWKINGIIIYLTDQGFSISKFSLFNKESYQEIESVLIRSLAELYLFADNCFLEGQLHIQDLSKASNENQPILQNNLVEKIRKSYSLKYWLGISEQGSFPKELSNLFSDDNKNIRACIREQEMRNTTFFPPSKEACMIWRNIVYQRCVKHLKGQESDEWKFFAKPKKINPPKNEVTLVDDEFTTLFAAIKLDIGKILIIEGSIGAINAFCFFVLEKLVKEKKACFSKLSLIAVKYGSSILITSLTGMLRNFYLNRFSIPFFLSDTSSQNQLANCATSIAINSVIIISSDIVGMGIERVGIKYNLKLFIKLLFAALVLFLDKEFYNNSFEWSVGFCMNFLVGLCVTGFLSVLWKKCKKEGKTQSRTHYMNSSKQIELPSFNDIDVPLLTQDSSQQMHKNSKIESIWLNIIKSLDKIRSQKGYAVNGNIDIYINAVDLLLNTREHGGKSSETLRDLDIRYKLILIFIEKIESFFHSIIQKTEDYQQFSNGLTTIKEKLKIFSQSAPGPLGIRNLRNDFYDFYDFNRNFFQPCKPTGNFQEIGEIFSILINHIGIILFYEDVWGEFEKGTKPINSITISDIIGQFNLLDQAIQLLNASIVKIRDVNQRTKIYNSLDALRINIAFVQKNVREQGGFLNGISKEAHLKFFKPEKNSINNLMNNNRVSNLF